MDAIEPKKSLVEQTYEILLDAICCGELLPGDRLNQDEIAARLNVSRQPVNSAISILKANHLVRDTGRRGVIVAEVDFDQFRSIFEFRCAIDPFAVTLAGRRLGEGAAEEAAAILAEGERAIARSDVRSLVDADVRFHEMIYGWSGNHVIERSMRSNWPHIRRSMADVLRDGSSARQSWNDHARIVDQLLAGRVDAAANTMQAHIERAFVKMRTVLDLSQTNAPNGASIQRETQTTP